MTSVSKPGFSSSLQAPTEELRNTGGDTIDSDTAKVKNCRDMLQTAKGWYLSAKEMIPEMAKPMLEKIEEKVDQQISQHPIVVEKVETFIDGQVLPVAEVALQKATTVLLTERVQTHVIAPGRAAVNKMSQTTQDILGAKATAAKTAASSVSAAALKNIDQAFTRAVEAGLDVVGQVVDVGIEAAEQLHRVKNAANKLEQRTTSFLKAKWRSPPTPSDLHASAIAVAKYVDELVDRNLCDSQEPTSESLTASNEPNTADVDRKNASPHSTISDTTSATSDVVVDKEGNTAERSVKLDNVAKKMVAASNRGNITSMARRIAGKVSLHLKKRVVRQLENAKGNIKMRTGKLIHSTNLIQYAKSFANDDRYVKLNTVLKEATNVVLTSSENVVRILSDTSRNANITGVELLHKGEETARMIIATTGKMTSSSRAYVSALAMRIRQRINDLKLQRLNQVSPLELKGQLTTEMSTASTQGDEFSEIPTSSALSMSSFVFEDIAEYMRKTASAGASTLFIFRDDLNQVLTYAFSAQSVLQNSTKFNDAVVQATWSALTTCKDAAAKQHAKVQETVKSLTQKGACILQQATTTWTNISFSEFADTVHVIDGHNLPVNFVSVLKFILQPQSIIDGKALTATEDVPSLELEFDDANSSGEWNSCD